MPRRVVLSDPESGSESGSGSGSGSEGGSEESDEESDEEQIVYDSEDDPLDKLEEALNRREPPRRAQRKRRRKHYSSEESGNESDDDDGSDDDSIGDYVNWEAMRAMYEKEGADGVEPTGYHEHRELHSWGWRQDKPVWSRADKDALWKHITDKTSDPAFRDQWGIRTVEREDAGQVERIVERFKYGDEFKDDYENALTGNYRDAFFRVMAEVFGQEPYQGPPDEGKLPEPRFLDFKWAYVSDDPIGADRAARRMEHAHGPFWCFCCQCTKKTLYKVTIARHTLSDIMVVTGGDCSEKFLGEDELPYNLEQHEHVGRLLGWAE